MKKSLGNNRPRNGYGAEGKRIVASLARHASLMAELMAIGMSKNDASREALKQLKAEGRAS